VGVAEWTARLRQAAAVAAHGSWRLHVLVAVGVIVASDNQRTTIDELQAAQFTVEVTGPSGLVGQLALKDARVMRPRPVDGRGWRWLVVYDTELAVAATVAADPQLTAIVSCDGADVVVDTARVDVVACLAVMPFAIGPRPYDRRAAA
jgi:transposase InsO family protein